MYNDQTHGDVTAGDGRFTTRLTVDLSAAGLLWFRVSVPYKGKLARVFSATRE